MFLFPLCACPHYRKATNANDESPLHNTAELHTTKSRSYMEESPSETVTQPSTSLKSGKTARTLDTFTVTTYRDSTIGTKSNGKDILCEKRYENNTYQTPKETHAERDTHELNDYGLNPPHFESLRLKKSNDRPSSNPRHSSSRRSRVLDDIPRQILVQSLSNDELEKQTPVISPVTPVLAPPASKSKNQQLIDFQKRNQAIGLKRREQISKARQRYQPGTHVSVPRSLYLRKHEDDYSTSSTSSSVSMYSSRSSASVSLLERKLREIHKRTRSQSTTPTANSTFSHTGSNISRSSSSSRSRCLQDFAERNREIGMRRKQEIARAREAAKPPSLRLPSVHSYAESRNRDQVVNPDSDEKRSSSSRSVSSRFDHLYERGKQKRRATLEESIQDKVKVTARKVNLTPTPQSRSANLAVRRRRHVENGIRRREEIAKARAASKPKIRELPGFHYEFKYKGLQRD